MVAASSKTELTLNLVRDWWTAHREGETAESAGEPSKDAVILAYRRDEVDRLNTTCQHVMQLNGRLGPEQLEVGDRSIHVGDQVVCGRNDLWRLGVANGTRGRVTTLNKQDRTLRLETEQGRQVTLPADYLNSPVPHGRRVVDLAYATTGHKAQGLTRWRALVRITGQEDANWLYVQLSRAKENTRLHTIVTPEPHAGAGELDLPDREPPDAYAQLAAALARPGGQRLAIDTTARLDVRTALTGDLRAERDRLQAELDQAPPDRSRVLERAVQRRRQAEQQLAAIEAEHPRQGRAGWLGRRRDASQDHDPAARALAARQAERAAQAEVETRAAQQRHEAWGEDHQEVGRDYQEVARELGLRSRQRVAFAELQQPAYLTAALGPVPESVRGRRAWRQTARLVEDYRQRFQIDDPDRPLGQPPPRDHHDPERQQAWQQASSAIQRMQGRQQRQLDRQQELDREQRPGSVRSIAADQRDQSTSRHTTIRQPNSVQGPERVAHDPDDDPPVGLSIRPLYQLPDLDQPPPRPCRRSRRLPASSTEAPSALLAAPQPPTTSAPANGPTSPAACRGG